MEPETLLQTGSLGRYLSNVRDAWGDGTDRDLPFKVQALMREFLTGTRRDEPWMAEMIAEGNIAKELYRDVDHGFIQMGHVQPQGHINPPHDHGPCWVVYGAYSGRTEIVVYAHRGTDSTTGKALLEKRDVHYLEPGVVYPYVPGDIHSVVVLEGPAIIFRFLSRDLTQVKRAYYDLERDATLVEPAAASA